MVVPAWLQGYQRTLVLEGCLRNFLSGLHAQPDLRYIDREAVAVLLGEGGSYGHLPRALVLDVRRSEERALYGSIKGSVHIPREQPCPGPSGTAHPLSSCVLVWVCVCGRVGGTTMLL